MINEKLIWTNLVRVTLVTIILLTTIILLPVTPISPFKPQPAYAANETYTWFASCAFPDGFSATEYNTGYIPLFGDYDIHDTEAATQWEANGDYTISNLNVRVTENSLTSNCTIVGRVNGVSGNITVTIPAGETGLFQDLTNYETLSDGDLFCWQATRDDTTIIRISFVSCNYEGQHPTVASTYAGDSVNTTDAGETEYINPSGLTWATSNASEADHYTYTSANISDMRLYVITNTTNNDTIVTSYVNGSTGNQTITIPAGTTGAFKDTTNTDVLGADDRWCYEVDATDSSSGGIQFMTTQVLFQSGVSSLSSAFPKRLIIDGRTSYTTISGYLVETTNETNAQQYMTANYTASNLWCHVDENTSSGDVYITTRIDGGDGSMSITIPAGVTGIFTDSVNTENYTVGEYIDIELDTNSASTDIRIDSIGIELTPLDSEASISTPTVTTQNATSVEETTSTGNGNITATGGENCTERGHEYDIDSGSPYSSNTTNSGSFSTGNFTTSLTGLTPGELYYSRAFAGNSAGYGYGSEVTFLTKPNGATSFTDTSTTNTSVSLSWTNGSGMDYVEIRYQESSYVSDNASGTLGYWGASSSTTVSGLSDNTTYYFSIYTHVNESGLWNTANTVGQDTALTGNPISPPVVAEDEMGVGEFLLRYILPVAAALAVCMIGLAIFGSFGLIASITVTFISIMVGLLTFYVIQSIVSTL